MRRSAVNWVVSEAVAREIREASVKGDPRAVEREIREASVKGDPRAVERMVGGVMQRDARQKQNAELWELLALAYGAARDIEGVEQVARRAELFGGGQLRASALTHALTLAGADTIPCMAFAASNPPATKDQVSPTPAATGRDALLSQFKHAVRHKPAADAVQAFADLAAKSPADAADHALQEAALRAAVGRSRNAAYLVHQVWLAVDGATPAAPAPRVAARFVGALARCGRCELALNFCDRLVAARPGLRSFVVTRAAVAACLRATRDTAERIDEALARKERRARAVPLGPLATGLRAKTPARLRVLYERADGFVKAAVAEKYAQRAVLDECYVLLARLACRVFASVPSGLEKVLRHLRGRASVECTEIVPALEHILQRLLSGPSDAAERDLVDPPQLCEVLRSFVVMCSAIAACLRASRDAAARIDEALARKPTAGERRRGPWRRAADQAGGGAEPMHAGPVQLPAGRPVPNQMHFNININRYSDTETDGSSGVYSASGGRPSPREGEPLPLVQHETAVPHHHHHHHPNNHKHPYTQIQLQMQPTGFGYPAAGSRTRSAQPSDGHNPAPDGPPAGPAAVFDADRRPGSTSVDKHARTDDYPGDAFASSHESVPPPPPYFAGAEPVYALPAQGQASGDPGKLKELYEKFLRYQKKLAYLEDKVKTTNAHCARLRDDAMTREKTLAATTIALKMREAESDSLRTENSRLRGQCDDLKSLLRHQQDTTVKLQEQVGNLISVKKSGDVSRMHEEHAQQLAHHARILHEQLKHTQRSDSNQMQLAALLEGLRQVVLEQELQKTAFAPDYPPAIQQRQHPAVLPAVNNRPPAPLDPNAKPLPPGPGGASPNNQDALGTFASAPPGDSTIPQELKDLLKRSRKGA
ncbi:hypothetical protein DIPPA_10875 [Diplonema papillatum]|nr:hypothetical protein DIPPA_10875 [Diplonema papillatum]